MILAIKTAGPTTELQLLAPDQTAPAPSETPATLVWESGRELAGRLLARLTDFLGAHDAGLTDLTGIVIFSGPGSFTSLRIGHSVANALADSLNLPVAAAGGENWIAEACHELSTQPSGRPVLPDYGSEAHITRPNQAPNQG